MKQYKQFDINDVSCCLVIKDGLSISNIYDIIENRMIMIIDLAREYSTYSDVRQKIMLETIALNNDVIYLASVVNLDSLNILYYYITDSEEDILEYVNANAGK